MIRLAKRRKGWKEGGTEEGREEPHLGIADATGPSTDVEGVCVEFDGVEALGVVGTDGAHDAVQLDLLGGAHA